MYLQRTPWGGGCRFWGTSGRRLIDRSVMRFRAQLIRQSIGVTGARQDLTIGVGSRASVGVVVEPGGPVAVEAWNGTRGAPERNRPPFPHLFPRQKASARGLSRRLRHRTGSSYVEVCPERSEGSTGRLGPSRSRGRIQGRIGRPRENGERDRPRGSAVDP